MARTLPRCRQVDAYRVTCSACKLRRPFGNQWAPIRRHALLRDDYRCQEGGGAGNVVDHITPIAHGGSDHPSNLRALCAPCNGRKGDR